MIKLSKLLLALSIAVVAGAGLVACDDDDATSTANQFVIQNN